MFIYEIVNKVNGMKLIGQTIQNPPEARWRAHKSHANNNKHQNCHFQRAWNKYGADSFEFKIVHTAQTQHELNLEEIKRIQENKDVVYNIIPGGNGGSLPEETKKRISLAKRGKPGPWLGKKRPDLSERNRKNNPMWSDSAKKQISDSNKKRAGEKRPSQSEWAKSSIRNNKGQFVLNQRKKYETI